MRPANCLVVALIGSLAGGIWATVLVDFEPRWYEDLPMLVKILILMLPLITHFCCALLFRWWRGKACLAYTAVVLAWWIAGDVYNEMAHVGNLTHFCPVSLVWFGLLVAGLTMSSWALGRWVRRVVVRVA